MIVADAEMSGLSPHKHSIVSLGAVDFDRPERTFYAECRTWEGAESDPEALAVCGFTPEDLKSPERKSFEELITLFYHWVENTPEKTLAGQNVSFDRSFLNDGFRRIGVDFAFGHRNFDLHSVAYADHMKRGIRIPQKNDHSDLSLDKILEYVGVPPEPRPHHALMGAKLEAEAFSRILRGKNLLPEFVQYPVPEIFLS